jgi:hypothetical protein
MPLRILSLLLFLAVPLVAMGQTSPDPVDFRLEEHRWEHRLLFVFAPAEARRTDQADRLDGHDEGFRDRDLLLLVLTGAEDGILRATPGAEPRPLTDAAVRRLYDRFDVPADAFRVILVGKDGTEKRRNAEPVSVRSVFDTIDAMPMRQREMRESSGGE